MYFDENQRAISLSIPIDIERVRNSDDIENYTLVETKTEYPTLQVDVKNRKMLLHSKYDPIREVERIIKDNDNNIREKNHIIFYGVGLGYHIEEMMREYPRKTFTLIEPNPSIFVRFLESRLLKSFPFQQMNSLFIKNDYFTLESFLINLSLMLKGDTALVVLPAYERIFKKETESFYSAYKKSLKSTQASTLTIRAFGKRWVLNSLMNLPTTLTTYNIHEKQTCFQGKPVVIASAGPSLYDDLQHLKYIKDKGLAYIFAVGSANKALLANGIIPDAVVTYDPQPHNVNVFNELIASGRTDIPMIYGTSVGFETLEAYPGPKFHMTTSADTVTNFYLNAKKTEVDIQDATTIALITLQLVASLKMSVVLLAGQNLAFKENRYYAQGIEYTEWKGQVREEREGKEILTTIDVYGNVIETNNSLMNMRHDIELFLENNSSLQVFNTTKAGAAIKGAPFKPIEDAIEEFLTEEVVVQNWYRQEAKEIDIYAIHQARKMDRAANRIYTIIEDCYKVLKQLDQLKQIKQKNRVNKLFNEYDKAFDKLLKNDFYKIFIQSVVQNEYEQLNKTIRGNYNEQELEKKIDVITSANIVYLQAVQRIFSVMLVYMKGTVHPKLYNTMEDRWKTHKHYDGVFHYEGQWQREIKSFNDISSSKAKRKLSPILSTMTNTPNSKVLFNFQGTRLQILATTHAEHASNVKIVIDGVERKFTTKNQRVKEGAHPNVDQVVFEIEGLPNSRHHVSIEMSTDEKFTFQGVRINQGGRIYHPHEVTSVEDLRVGKRIRCHYKATTNQVGTFSNLGKTNKPFIPVTSTPQPHGDFYFIMVDEVDGEKKLIADRNVQNYISFNTLIEQLSNAKIPEFNNSTIRLLQLSKEGEIDEWLGYIRDNAVVKDSELVWNHVRNSDEKHGVYSIVKIIRNKPGIYSKLFNTKNKTINIHSHLSIETNTGFFERGFRPFL